MMKALTWAACERLIRCLPRSSGTKNGGIPGESERGWRDLRRAIPMLNHQAAVLDEWNGGVGGEFHCLGGADAALQPDPLGTDCDGFTDDTGAMLGAAEDVDQIDRAGHFGQRWITAQAQHGLVVRI